MFEAVISFCCCDGFWFRVPLFVIIGAIPILTFCYYILIVVDTFLGKGGSCYSKCSLFFLMGLSVPLNTFYGV